MLIKNKLYKAANPETQYCFRPNLFMWSSRTLFFGTVQHLALHSMGSIAINVGLYQPFYMKTVNGGYIPYRCAIILAGCNHELQAFGNIVACLIIEKNSLDFISLKRRFPLHTSAITRINDAEWIDCFQKIYQEKPAKEQIEQLINQLLAVGAETDKNIIDSRIDSIMQTIQFDAGYEFSQQYMAASVGLSPSRFRHLFREQSDIPYRRYRIWRRVIAAIAALHKVDNLTHAAMEAGFTDSAHFNHCFRATFGINPSLVFRNIDRFDV